MSSLVYIHIDSNNIYETRFIDGVVFCRWFDRTSPIQPAFKSGRQLEHNYGITVSIKHHKFAITHYWPTEDHSASQKAFRLNFDARRDKNNNKKRRSVMWIHSVWRNHLCQMATKCSLLVNKAIYVTALFQFSCWLYEKLFVLASDATLRFGNTHTY